MKKVFLNLSVLVAFLKENNIICKCSMILKES